MSLESFRVTYEIYPGTGENAEARALDITLEQTVELPAVAVPATAQTMIGQVESLDRVDGRCWQARIAYPLASIGTELNQLLTVLFGNISLKDGIRAIAIDWPGTLLKAFGGPGHGIAGLRGLTGIQNRALVATALKPMGLSANALAARCAAFARGGINIIKDDHGLANQRSAPFAQRLARCQTAVADANAASGHHALYFPNVTAAWPTMTARAEAAKKAGCAGVLISPWLTGLDAMAWLRDQLGLVVMAHPALTGAYFHREHGISAELLLGEIFRIAGADVVIYPNYGGRFGFSQALCERINGHLRQPLGDLRPALPTPAGGINVGQAGYWAEHYGHDTVLLIGSSLYQQDDLTSASAALIQAIEHAHEQ